MSRLDSFIRRLCAQRACLDMAADLIADQPGPVLELGLGNGRTFDHLRSLMPEREIFVFERNIAAHPQCIPDDAHLILGDVFETLPTAFNRIGHPAVLAHADVGTGDENTNAKIAAFLATNLPPQMAERALIVADQRVDPPGWQRHPLPEGVAPERYFVYRRG